MALHRHQPGCNQFAKVISRKVKWPLARKELNVPKSRFRYCLSVESRHTNTELRNNLENLHSYGCIYHIFSNLLNSLNNYNLELIRDL